MFSAKIDEWFDVLDQGQAEADVWLRQGGYSPVRGYMRIMGGGGFRAHYTPATPT